MKKFKTIPKEIWEIDQTKLDQFITFLKGLLHQIEVRKYLKYKAFKENS